MPHPRCLSSKRLGLTWLFASLVAAHGAVAAEGAPPTKATDRDTNRLKVTGNRSVQQDAPPCVITPSDGKATANVNSVTLDGARLEGRTVVVAGRNSSNVDASRCHGPSGRPQTGASANVNSINLR